MREMLAVGYKAGPLTIIVPAGWRGPGALLTPGPAEPIRHSRFFGAARPSLEQVADLRIGQPGRHQLVPVDVA